MKMSSHLCYEFGKSVMKCDCCRKRKYSFLQTDPADGKKPLWMISGFNYQQKKSGLGASISNGALN